MILLFLYIAFSVIVGVRNAKEWKHHHPVAVFFGTAILWPIRAVMILLEDLVIKPKINEYQ